MLRPENFEVSIRYFLKHVTFGGSNIFQLFDTSEKPNHFVASRRWLESQGRDGERQENGQNEWHDLGYQGAKAEAPMCLNSTLQTPLPQQSSSSAREEEDQWEVTAERRRRRIAFENLAKGMLRYLDNCNEVKVGHHCIARTSGGAVAIRYFRSESGAAGHERRWPKDFRSILAGREKNYVLPAGPDGRRSGKAFVDLEKKVSKTWVVKYNC